MDKPPGLEYDWGDRPPLAWGYNDVNGDGIADTLLTVWNGRKVLFISDDGKLPWLEEDEGRDWNAYFNAAFNVGKEPPAMWNEMRGNWGNYTLLVQKTDDVRFDGLADRFYKVLDFNGDGAPEAEYFNLFSAQDAKLHVNLSGERDGAFLDWQNFAYGDEQRYLPGGKYIMNVHGNGFFLLSYSADVRNAWENPIAWYDFDFDGRTNMVMRAADCHKVGPGDESEPMKLLNPKPYRGELAEFEIAFELNGNTGPNRWHSLDMQLTFYQYGKPGPGYEQYVDNIRLIRGMPEAAFLSEARRAIRLETVHRHFPYLDGFKIASEFDQWQGVWLLFDEDDDDNRWEEMFRKHEPWWSGFADQLGDRGEVDTDYGGRGKLYVGKFDGRIHLYHAEEAYWDVDYLTLYKGSADRKDRSDTAEEGPEPPVGLRYPTVRYFDKNGNGFIDTIEYATVECGREADTRIVQRTVSLLDYEEDADVCDLIDLRVSAPISGWKLEGWDGNPVGPEFFEGTPNKEIYDKMMALYAGVADDMWAGASTLCQVAKKHGLCRSESQDKDLKTDYTREELAALTDVTVPAGYSRHLSHATKRERYHNGYWLREKVFKDIKEHPGLDVVTLEKLYYTGKIDALCGHIEDKLAD